MAKSQRHGNREAKKPKAIKIVPPPATTGLLAKGTLAATKKKGD